MRRRLAVFILITTIAVIGFTVDSIGHSSVADGGAKQETSLSLADNKDHTADVNAEIEPSVKGAVKAARTEVKQKKQKSHSEKTAKVKKATSKKKIKSKKSARLKRKIKKKIAEMNKKDKKNREKVRKNRRKYEKEIKKAESQGKEKKESPKKNEESESASAAEEKKEDKTEKNVKEEKKTESPAEEKTEPQKEEIAPEPGYKIVEHPEEGHTVIHYYCKCGEEVESVEAWKKHRKDFIESNGGVCNGEHGNYYMEEEYVVDKPAWSEQVPE